MSNPGTKACRFAGLLLAASIATAAAAETHSIGTLGATIPGDAWERHTLSADFGPDQFIRADRSFFMVVFESFKLYDERADFMEGLDTFLTGMTVRFPDWKFDPETGYLRSLGFTRATRWVFGEIGSMSLGYEVDLISAGDGVGYVFLSWSPLSDFDALKEQLDRTLSELKLPGPDSEWSQRATPTSHKFSFEDWTLELRFRDSVFTEGASKPGARYSLVASGGSLAVHIFLDELEGDADHVLDEVKRVVAGGDAYQELSRSDLDRDVGPGRQLLMRSGGTPPSDVAIAVIGLGDDRWVDLRMVSTNRAGHREALWDGLVQSLLITRPEEVDAFPVVAESPTAEPEHIEPSARQLLEASRDLGAHGSEVVALRGSDGLLARDGARLELHSAIGSDDASTEVLYESDRYTPGDVVPWGNRILIVATDGKVSAVADGELQPAGFEADVAAAAGTELLIARNGRREPLLGFAGLPAAGPATILARDGDGKERLVVELPADDVAALAHRPSGDVLVATTPRTELATDDQSSAKRLLLVRDGTGQTVEIGRWDRIDRLEPAPGGWLITGAPSAGRQGVHLVGDAGRSELLLSGDPVGLSLADGELTFVSGSCLVPADGYLPRCVYRADLDRVRELGPTYQPFTSQILNEIGLRVRPQLEGSYVEGFPPTREAISEFSAAAEKVAVELAGTGLPRSRAGVDALLSRLSYDRDLSESGIVLLSVLLTDSLLSDGAMWENAATPALAARGTFGWELKNPFAVGLNPVTAVLSALYEEDGWYRPAQGLLDEARGRTIVLGLDRERVRARVRAAVPPEMEELLRTTRTSQLAAVFERKPENVYLRETVYKHLAAHGDFATLATLAEPFATRDDADEADLLPWIATRLRGELSPSQAGEAIADLRDAIEHEPGKTGLYLLLGAAYERSTEPDRLALARACYRKAEETATWGSLHTAAEQALERLATVE